MLIVNVIMLSVIIFAIILSCRYCKDFIKNEGTKDLKIPLALWLVDKLKILERSNSKIKAKLANLSIYRDVDDVIRMHFCKKISLIIAVILVCNVICICNAVMKEKSMVNYIKTLQRPDYGKDDKEVELDVKIQDEKEKKLNINIAANQLSKEKKTELINDVKSYVYKELIKNNSSYQNVTKRLNLINSYPDDKNIEISWILDDSNCINEKGYVKNVNKQVTITAIINYFDYEERYNIPLHIKKSNEVEKDEIYDKIYSNIKKQNDNYSENGEIVLPEKIDNVKVSYKNTNEEQSKNIPYVIITLSIIAIIAIVFFKDKEIDEKMNERKELLMINYPEILNKFALLISAGFTIKKAWAKICVEYKTNLPINYTNDYILLESYNNMSINTYQNQQDLYVTKTQNKKQRVKRKEKQKDKIKINYTYEEMIYTLKEMYNGKSEIDAYEDFGKRIGLVQYMKLSSLFVQSIVSGVSNIVNLLEMEAFEAHKEKKEYVKQYGEKIGTKMLLPIVGLLIVTLTIIVIPVMLV